MDKLVLRPDGTYSVQLVFHDEDGNAFDDPKLMTKQCFKDECDINNIVQRYRKTGALPPPLTSSGIYGDFSDIGTFQDAMIKIEEAQCMFDALPAKLRARFDNDTSQFLDFVDNPANANELVEMGLVSPSANPVDVVDSVESVAVPNNSSLL